MDFIVDLALLFHTRHQMQVKANSVSTASALVDLKIHKVIVATLRYKTENTNAVTLDGITPLEVVDKRKTKAL